jgi:hypothetical protein
MKRLGALVLTFTFVLSVGYSPKNRFALHKNQKAMKQEILKVVSIGDDINVVKKIMEAKGFKCTLVVKRIIKDYVEGNDEAEKISDRPLNFLSCYKYLHTSTQCSDEWKICFVNDTGKVSLVLVSTGRVCT